MDLTQQRTALQTAINNAKTLNAEIERKLAAGETVDPLDREKLQKMIADGQTMRKDLEQAEALKGLDDFAGTPGERKTADTPTPAGGDGAAAQPFAGYKSMGRSFVETKQFKDLKAGDAKSAAMLAPQWVKAILGETALSGGETIRADRRTEIIDIARQRPRSVLDYVNLSETELGSVEYVKMTGRTDTTAIVAEAAEKPEGDLAFDVDSATVKVIAEWIKASNQILSDAPRLRNLIDNELRYMVETKLENVVVADMLAASGIQSRVHATSGRAFSADDSIADSIRRAITDIRLEFYEPDVVILHPTQGEAMELERGTDGHYVNVYDPVAMRVWRKPVVETPAMTSGTGAVSQLRLAYTVWMREDARVNTGYVDKDFIMNLITILGELRAAYAMVRPKAFEKITGF